MKWIMINLCTSKLHIFLFKEKNLYAESFDLPLFSLKVLQPNLEDVQQALNKATTCVLEVSRGVAQWGQSRTRPIEPAVTFEEPGKHRHGTHSGKSSKFFYGNLKLSITIRFFINSYYYSLFQRYLRLR